MFFSLFFFFLPELGLPPISGDTCWVRVFFLLFVLVGGGGAAEKYIRQPWQEFIPPIAERLSNVVFLLFFSFFLFRRVKRRESTLVHVGTFVLDLGSRCCVLFVLPAHGWLSYNFSNCWTLHGLVNMVLFVAMGVSQVVGTALLCFSNSAPCGFKDKPKADEPPDKVPNFVP